MKIEYDGEALSLDVKADDRALIAEIPEERGACANSPWHGRNVLTLTRRSAEPQGAEVDTIVEPNGTKFVDEDPALRYVDPSNRKEVERYDRWDEAELACGLLRTSGIACELSPMPLPGLPADIILWVHNRDAELAWAILADAEREASLKAKAETSFDDAT